MKNQINAVHDLAEQSSVANIALNEGDAARRERDREILPPPAHEIVEHYDFACPFSNQQLGDMRTDKARPSGNQHPL